MPICFVWVTVLQRWILRQTLCNAAITNAVKCVPPDNKPVAEEVRNCSEFLESELRASGKVVLALGRVAHESVLKALALSLTDYRFGHGTEHWLPDGRILVSSYHCSRYNVQTGRLSRAQFDAVFDRAAHLLQSKTT
jgi:uracil-DNA glycosylase family 4